MNVIRPRAQKEKKIQHILATKLVIILNVNHVTSAPSPLGVRKWTEICPAIEMN